MIRSQELSRQLGKHGQVAIFAVFGLRRSADGDMLRRPVIVAVSGPGEGFVSVVPGNAAGGLQVVGKSL
ncbi:hypothetical protein [Xanthomonas oryzae]|uniref:hypothetical protein n=1 Tax=Xanthomonas oryzae TaxID=347 RepID=UPI001396B767|nr:hypothetical protein [Xanthomonas oryzae]ULX26503.1 hypothetical protein IYN96_19010 [Xanthomonas oryzae pv. oryzicola]WGY41120.1 hypothetical protein HED68_19435 [Xanthomonas oryzae pv. oryzicola]